MLKILLSLRRSVEIICLAGVEGSTNHLARHFHPFGFRSPFALNSTSLRSFSKVTSELHVARAAGEQVFRSPSARRDPEYHMIMAAKRVNVLVYSGMATTTGFIDRIRSDLYFRQRKYSGVCSPLFVQSSSSALT